MNRARKSRRFQQTVTQFAWTTFSNGDVWLSNWVFG